MINKLKMFFVVSVTLVAVFSFSFEKDYSESSKALLINNQWNQIDTNIK